MGVAVGISTSAYPQPTLLADPLTVPTLIITGAGTAGSGCFIQLSNSVYLVTARHVLFAEPQGTTPPSLLSPMAQIRSYSQAGTTNVSARDMSLNLAQLFRDGEIRYSTNRDVTLVRVEECIPGNSSVGTPLPGVYKDPRVGISTSGDVWSITNIQVGGDVFMFGYPLSLTAPIQQMFDPSQPLLRKGIVAGVNLEKRVVIVDCPSYQGNSGGPVIQIDHPSFGLTANHIIGVVSSFVPFEEEWENKTLHYSHKFVSNSGYTIIEPMDIALELVWK
jgi:hypothetical protein